MLELLADLPDQARFIVLRGVLDTYDEALRFCRAEDAPLEYARTQHNRGIVLRKLSDLPGEDRRAWLLAALQAYDEALIYRRLDTVPLAYAMTLNNRTVVVLELADLPGEDRPARQLEALDSVIRAGAVFAQAGHERLLESVRGMFVEIRRAAGDEFEAMWAELGAGEPPAWLRDAWSGDEKSADEVD